ncbi:phosphatase and tensin-like protein [Arctopsyche grandis]|uniref:phosphatase and tensin-like protein n=1 Tax=Arctopsyche grandis TaxID=121162 RepID=UPI00406D89A4
MSGPLAMANPLRNIVSKQRIRYQKDGFNLDLTYITKNLIAMGYPGDKLEGIYRNHIDEVFRMLEANHCDHYKIYNLCSERSYDSGKFRMRVAVYAFDDHNPPTIELIQRFCEDVHSWLSKDPENIAAVHCKAGKGRTGTMICCYLLFSEQFKTASEALKFYGQKRAYDEKGVTIPSQRRYVEYYAILLNKYLSEIAVSSPTSSVVSLYKPPTLLILELLMQPPPSLNGGQGSLEFSVLAANRQSSQKGIVSLSEARKSPSCIRIQLDRCTPIVGDIKVEVFNKPKIAISKEKLFHFWFNTFFVTYNAKAVGEPTSERNGSTSPTYKLTLNKWELDDAHKDTQHKTYASDFKVQLVMQCVPEDSSWGQRVPLDNFGGEAAPASPSSSVGEDDSEGSAEPEEGWDSAVEGAAGGVAVYHLLSEPDDLDNIPNSAPNAHTPASPPEVERMLHA